MKPVTAFWLALIPLLIAGNVWAWGRNPDWVRIVCIGLLVITFAFWVNEGRKEHRQRSDLENLTKDLANEVIALKMLIVIMNPSAGETDDNR